MVSDLVDGVIETDKHGERTAKICKITPHHMNAHWTGKHCAEYFRDTTRQASSNYCIGYNGDIWCSVPEEFRAWTSSNKENDNQAITIECSNSSLRYPYPISGKTWNALIDLCVDICERYDFRLDFNGTPSGSLTAHRFFANTDCPGDYLYRKFDELEREVNARLDAKNILTLEDIADLDLYYDANKDVAKAYGRDTQKLWEHLTNYGIKEGRTFSYVFNAKWYANKYEDIRKAYGSDWSKITDHYLGAGAKEGRQAYIEFDPKYYMEKNKDLQKAGLNYIQAVKHFEYNGINEWRETSKEFNVKHYRDRYKDLRKAFGNKCILYYKHYLLFGINERRIGT